MTIVRMVHVRQSKQCSRGARAFFERHNLDWQSFLRDGIDAKELRATGDAMAQAVVEQAERMEHGG